MAKQPGFLKRGEQLRLQAFLSRSGLASRRAAEEMITRGRVKVNGREVTAQGIKVTAGVDRVEVDGVEVKVAPTTWVALHKPKGYVTTRQDPYGRKTVYELLPEKYHGLFHVGRLDRDSEGLLLLTNDGDLANRFLHPSFGITKEYDVVATGKPSDAALRELMEGVELEDGIARAESARLIGPAGNGMSRLKMVLREGRKREVRRMLEAVGHPVKRLVRRSFGPVELGELPEGKWRVVQPEELSHVRDARAAPRRKRPAEPAAESARPRTQAGARAEARPPRGGTEGQGRPAREERPARGRKPERGGARGGSFRRDEAAPAPRERVPVDIDWDAEEWGDERPARPRGGPSRARPAEDRPPARGTRTGPGRGTADRAERPGDRAAPRAGRGGPRREDRPRRDAGGRPGGKPAGGRPGDKPAGGRPGAGPSGPGRRPGQGRGKKGR